jgi:hypothetical protein
MLRDLFNSLDSRVRKLEQSQSFEAPAVTSDPSPLRNGMIWYRSDLKKFETYDNGAVRPIGEMKYYGSFYDTTTQTTASSTAINAVKLNTTSEANGFSIVSNTRITPTYSGVYNVQFSFQMLNADTSQNNDAFIWLRVNGSDVADSTGQITIPNKHSGINGAVIASWNYVLTLNVGQYLEFVWNSASTQVSIGYVAATSGPPVIPSIPSAIVTIQPAAW